MSVDYIKTPWPWFGGKADAAPHVWEALGDVDHYVEPFAGSLAVLPRRPHEANRSYYSETVNDLDGLLVNAWRSMQLSPADGFSFTADSPPPILLRPRHPREAHRPRAPRYPEPSAAATRRAT